MPIGPRGVVKLSREEEEEEEGGKCASSRPLHEKLFTHGTEKADIGGHRRIYN